MKLLLQEGKGDNNLEREYQILKIEALMATIENAFEELRKSTVKRFFS